MEYSYLDTQVPSDLSQRSTHEVANRKIAGADKEMLYQVARTSMSYSKMVLLLVAIAAINNATLETSVGQRVISDASQAGLAIEWTNQIDVGATGELVDVYIDVSRFGKKVPIPFVASDEDQYISLAEREARKIKREPENLMTVYYVIEYDGQRERISQNDFDAFGNKYGIAGAEKRAKLRTEIIAAELKARGKMDAEIKVTQLTLPRTTIYALSSAGVVTALDGDTGRVKWKRKVGVSLRPTIGLGANANFVAATNGSSVFCMNAENGKVLWERRCGSSPSASPAVSDDYVYVPLVNEKVEIFSLKNNGLEQKQFLTSGRGTDRPLLTDTTISWPTNTGYYNVAPIDSNRTISYRLRTTDSIAAGAAFKSFKEEKRGKVKNVGMLFISSTDGYVRALHEAKGSVLWEFSTGDRISQSPFLAGNFLYVITDTNKLYRLDALTGIAAPGWQKPITGFTQFAGASDTRLYLLDLRGRVNVVDPESGSRLGLVQSAPMNMVVPNTLTDRLYVGNRSGVIQCLREAGTTYPQFKSKVFAEDMNADDGPEMKKEKDPFKNSEGMDDEPIEDDSEDPFAADAEAEDDDPFATGGDSEESDNESNPFDIGGDGDEDDGDEEDPFGGGGDSSDDESEDEDGDEGEEEEEEEDPFGGGTP